MRSMEGLRKRGWRVGKFISYVVFPLKVIPIKLFLNKVSSLPADNVFMDDENTTKAAWAGFLVSAITVLTSFRPSRDFRLL